MNYMARKKKKSTLYKNPLFYMLALPTLGVLGVLTLVFANLIQSPTFTTSQAASSKANIFFYDFYTGTDYNIMRWAAPQNFKFIANSNKNERYVSADIYGTVVSYISFANGNQGDLYITDGNGKSRKRVTNTPLDEMHPYVARNGSKIVFSQVKRPSSSRNMAADIWTVNPDGSKLKRLRANSRWEVCPTFSHDNKKIVYFDSVGTNLPQRIRYMSASGSNKKIIPNTSAFVFTTDNGCPIFSADNTRIIFAARHPNHIQHTELYQIKLNGTGIKRLTKSSMSSNKGSNVGAGHPHLSPDKSQIVFNINNGNKINLYKMNSNGSNVTKLIGTGSPTNATWTTLPTTAGGSQPSDDLSGDQSFGNDANRATTLIFSYIDRSGYDIARGVTEQQLQILRNSTYDEYFPTVNTNGTQMAYVSYASGLAELYTANGQYKNIKRLTTTPDDETTPNISRDGKSVVFSIMHNADINARRPKADMYSINVDGSKLKRLSNNGHWEVCPVYAHDKSLIAYHDSLGTTTAQKIMTMRIGGGGKTTVPKSETFQYANNGCPVFTPDNKGLIFAARANGHLNHAELYKININGSGTPTRLTTTKMIKNGGATTGAGHPALSPNGKNVVYAVDDGESTDFYLYNLDSKVSGRATHTKHPIKRTNPSWVYQ